MSNRISLKLSDKNDWLVDALKDESEKENRPSLNNMIESILVDYFNNISTNSFKTPSDEKIKKASKHLGTLHFPRLINDPYEPIEDDNLENRRIFMNGFEDGIRYVKDFNSK